MQWKWKAWLHIPHATEHSVHTTHCYFVSISIHLHFFFIYKPNLPLFDAIQAQHTFIRGRLLVRLALNAFTPHEHKKSVSIQI